MTKSDSCSRRETPFVDARLEKFEDRGVDRADPMLLAASPGSTSGI